ncbi:HET-domain-containing protein [Hypoxylon crocopeplum]|nr:HET-domain-containing protein [Hypoxylon crocopeplum]
MSASASSYVMSGAIRPHGKKETPPASSSNLGQQEDLIQYFIERQRAIARGTKRTFSIDEPHRCVECQGINIDATTFIIPEKIHLCPHLRSAIDAAIAGCAFYEWLVDLLILESDGSPDETPFLGASSADISFYIELNTRRNPEWYMLFMVYADLIGADGEYETHTLLKGSLNAWTTEGNLAAPYIRHRPTELDKASQRTMQFVHDSLQVCKTSHVECRYMEDQSKISNEHEIIALSDLPTRLLQIVSDAQSVKLVVTQDLTDAAQHSISDQGYASLSYCWGGAQPLQLTRNTLEKLRRGIDIDELPQTLRDAVHTTVALGLSHIWIDALCILQDDASDVALEISRMPLYYGANTVTISAESAAACTDGFLSRGAATFAAGPFEVAFTTELGRGSIQLFQGSRDEEIAPISRRGWTFQESMLSRRMVAFGESQAVWCCSVASTGCGGIFSADDDFLGVSGSNFTMAVVLRYSFEDAWDMIVQEFMGRALSVESDKLLAISALASRMVYTAIERKLSVRYLAGLFVNTASIMSWARGLLWLVNPEVAYRPRMYRAPSWSWAALDSFWSHLHVFLPPPYDIRKYEFDFKVTDAGVELSHPKAPYGGIKEAWITVNGWAKRIDGSPGVNIIFQEWPKTRLMAEERTVADLVLFCDTREDRGLVELALHGQKGNDDIFLLEIIPSYLAKNTPSVGLILVDKMKSGVMSRIGAYVFYFAASEVGRQVYERFFDGMLEDCRLV